MEGCECGMLSLGGCSLILVPGSLSSLASHLSMLEVILLEEVGVGRSSRKSAEDKIGCNLVGLEGGEVPKKHVSHLGRQRRSSSDHLRVGGCQSGNDRQVVVRVNAENRAIETGEGLGLEQPSLRRKGVQRFDRHGDECCDKLYVLGA